MCVFVANRYYKDYGLEYIRNRLQEELQKQGKVMRTDTRMLHGFDSGGKDALLTDMDIQGRIVIFWDKNHRLARALEKAGCCLLPNGSRTLRICDDKELTYAAVTGSGIRIPETIVHPLKFDVNGQEDEDFLDLIERRLQYPVIVKQNIGSQGRQVYLAEDRAELKRLNEKLQHLPHMYQRFCGEKGKDIRVYTIGGKVVGSVLRHNTTDFKSNVAMGGSMEPICLSAAMREAAEQISGMLGLGYGSIDFLQGEQPIFLEANSNAYFKGIEVLGIPIAARLAEYIVGASRYV